MLAVLEATSSAIELSPDHMVMTSADTGERLEFVTTSPLEGSTWLLAAVDGRATRRSQTVLRLVDGVASGFSACGDFETEYVTNGVLVRFIEVPGVPDGCSSTPTERRFRSALRRARFADLTRPVLRLIDASGSTVARFSDPSGP